MCPWQGKLLGGQLGSALVARGLDGHSCALGFYTTSMCGIALEASQGEHSIGCTCDYGWGILGKQMHAKQQDRMSDVAVRKELGVPSIDNVVRRARLRYLATLSTAPDSLWALLQSRPGGKPLPWIELVVDDLRKMQLHLSTELRHLGDPVEQAEAWHSLITDLKGEYLKLVGLFVTCEDDLANKTGASEEVVTKLANSAEQLDDSLVCCGIRFASEKAWAQHRRTKHDERSVFSVVVPGTGVCPACGANFHSRVRLLTSHLGDKRRNVRCREAVAKLPRLPDDLAEELNKKDREQRMQAAHEGHTHVLAGRPAERAPGWTRRKTTEATGCSRECGQCCAGAS